jgi:L,D-peptidoglycan transpeptidase YkuD (ErfK/YbiS/YcfS/YnhG family)
MWIPFAHHFGLIQRWGPTDGCIALSNDDVEELYRHVDVGTPVIISP